MYCHYRNTCISIHVSVPIMAEKPIDTEMTPEELTIGYSDEPGCKITVTPLQTYKDVVVRGFINGSVVIDWPHSSKKPFWNLYDGVGCKGFPRNKRYSRYDFKAPKGTVGDLCKYQVILDRQQKYSDVLKMRDEYFENADRRGYGIADEKSQVPQTYQFDFITNYICYEISNVHCGENDYRNILDGLIRLSSDAIDVEFTEKPYIYGISELDDDDDYYDDRDWD